MSALAAYEAALRSGSSITARTRAGQEMLLPLARWLCDASVCDQQILRLCTGRTLEVGCGPGRLTHALWRNGQHAVGVDVSPQAVRLARARGVIAYCQDVFDDFPEGGTWDHVLLADGNIGIGGDPERLLRRCRHLAGSRGTVIVEVEPRGARDECGLVRVSAEGLMGWLPWAWVSMDSISTWAHRAGLMVEDAVVTESGRHAVALAAVPDAVAGGS